MKRYILNGRVYDSRSEAAVSGLMERYIPEFNPSEGRNLHVQCNSTSTDFMIQDTLIEWHPRKRLETSLEYERRKRNLLASSQYNKNELLVITSLQELYERVLLRFGKNVPRIEIVQGQFGSLITKSRIATKKRLEDFWRGK